MFVFISYDSLMLHLTCLYSGPLPLLSDICGRSSDCYASLFWHGFTSLKTALCVTSHILYRPETFAKGFIDQTPSIYTHLNTYHRLLAGFANLRYIHSKSDAAIVSHMVQLWWVQCQSCCSCTVLHGNVLKSRKRTHCTDLYYWRPFHVFTPLLQLHCFIALWHCRVTGYVNVAIDQQIRRSVCVYCHLSWSCSKIRIFLKLAGRNCSRNCCFSCLPGISWIFFMKLTTNDPRLTIVPFSKTSNVGFWD